MTESLIQPFGAIVAATDLPIPEDRIAGVNTLVAEIYTLAAKLREAGIRPVDEPANIYHAGENA